MIGRIADDSRTDDSDKCEEIERLALEALSDE